MNIPKIAPIASIFLLSLNLSANEIYTLNLDSTIAIAKRQSYSMRMLREKIAQSEYQLKSITRSYLPQLSLNGSVPQYAETVSSYEDSSGIHYFPKKQSTLSGNLQLSQVLPTNGKLYLRSGVSSLRDLYYKNKFVDMNTSIRFEQPIEALYAYNEMRANYRQAKLQYELSSKQYKREELDLIYSISEVFYSVVAAQKRLGIAELNLKRQEETYQTAKNKYDAGLIREVEALQIEVDLGDAVNQYDVQVTNFKQLSNQLKQEIGIPLSDSVITEHNLTYNVVLVDPQTAVENGLKNRPEVGERQIQIEISEISIKRQKAQQMVSGTLSGYYDFIGNNKYSINYPDMTAFDETYNTMINRRANRGIALTVKIPLLDWGSNRALVRQQQSKLRQNQLQLDYNIVQIENEIRSKVSSISSNLRRLQLLEKNVKLAEKSYNISYQRFNNGDIDAEALNLDRTRYNNAQQSYLEAYISYKLGLLDLNRRTLYDFENNRSFVGNTEK